MVSRFGVRLGDQPRRFTDIEHDAIAWAIEEDGDDDAPMRHEQKYGPGFDSLFLNALRAMLAESAPESEKS
jgi:hypothetical protein